MYETYVDKGKFIKELEVGDIVTNRNALVLNDPVIKIDLMEDGRKFFICKYSGIWFGGTINGWTKLKGKAIIKYKEKELQKAIAELESIPQEEIDKFVEENKNDT